MPPVVTREPTRLSKSALIKRLDHRSRERYGGEFNEGFLNDLIKDGLLPSLERSENQGRRPTYFATAFHFRRALQIKRLVHQGIPRRDAQLIQLFVRGYGVGPWQIREELKREFVRAVAKLRPTLRSAFFQSSREVPTKTADIIRLQTGPLDERLAAAGLEQPMSFYLGQVRSAFGIKGDLNIPAFFSWLLVEGQASEFPDFLEAAFRCDDEVLNGVKMAFGFINRYGFRKMLGNAVQDSAEFTTVVLVSMLIAEELGFTPESLLDKLPQQAGFGQFLAGLLDGVKSELSSN